MGVILNKNKNHLETFPRLANLGQELISTRGSAASSYGYKYPAKIEFL